MGKRSVRRGVHRRIFFEMFFVVFSVAFLDAVLKGFWRSRNLLFSVFTAELQCFLRFNEVRRRRPFLMNLRLFWGHFWSIFMVKNSLVFMIFSITAAGCILGAFWGHFGHPLAPFWLPLGSVGAPLVPFGTPLAPLWHPFRSMRLPGGVLWAPFRSLLAFWQRFAWILSVFFPVWPCVALFGRFWRVLAVFGRIWRYPRFFY